MRHNKFRCLVRHLLVLLAWNALAVLLSNLVPDVYITALVLVQFPFIVYYGIRADEIKRREPAQHLACPLLVHIDDVRSGLLARFPELLRLPEQQRERILEMARAKLDQEGTIERRVFLVNMSIGILTPGLILLLCPECERDRTLRGWILCGALLILLVLDGCVVAALKRQMMTRALWTLLPGRCSRCGADLRHATTRLCPECAAVISDDDSSGTPLCAIKSAGG